MIFERNVTITESVGALNPLNSRDHERHNIYIAPVIVTLTRDVGVAIKYG